MNESPETMDVCERGEHRGGNAPWVGTMDLHLGDLYFKHGFGDAMNLYIEVLGLGVDCCTAEGEVSLMINNEEYWSNDDVPIAQMARTILKKATQRLDI